MHIDTCSISGLLEKSSLCLYHPLSLTALGASASYGVKGELEWIVLCPTTLEQHATKILFDGVAVYTALLSQCHAAATKVEWLWMCPAVLVLLSEMVSRC